MFLILTVPSKAQAFEPPCGCEYYIKNNYMTRLSLYSKQTMVKYMRHSLRLIILEIDDYLLCISVSSGDHFTGETNSNYVATLHLLRLNYFSTDCRRSLTGFAKKERQFNTIILLYPILCIHLIKNIS